MARRKCAGFARISSAEREISKNKDLLAEDSVCCEPVSTLNSLITGKNTGNFTRFAGKRTWGASIMPVISDRYSEFPYETEQGISIDNREFSFIEQRISGMEMGKWEMGNGKWDGVMGPSKNFRNSITLSKAIAEPAMSSIKR